MKTQASSTQTGFLSEHPSGSGACTKGLMVFRFWVPTSGIVDPKLAEYSPLTDLGILAMIEDVAASKQGVLHTTHDQLFVSGLQQPADALVVSRQVQLGLQGFRGRHGSGSISVTIAMDASQPAHPTPAETAPAGRFNDAQPSSTSLATNAPEPPHDLVTLLKLAKPAQILVTHDLYRQLASIKGLPLKSFPGRFGVYEYLWATEEKLEVLQSEPQLTLAALPASNPASGSVQIKESHIQAISADAAPSNAIPEEINLGTGHVWQTAFSSPRPVFFAAIALFAIVALALVGIRMAHSPHSQPAKAMAPASLQNPPSQAGNPAVRPATKLNPSSAIRNALQTAVRRVVAPAQHKPSPIAETVPAPSSSPAPKGECTLPGDSSRYVNLAEQYRGRGDYTHAEHLFRQILDCNPNDSAAREGLNRTLQGEQQNPRQR